MLKNAPEIFFSLFSLDSPRRKSREITDFPAHIVAIHEDYSFMKFANNFNYFP